MSKMIFRPQTGDRHVDGMRIHKTKFKELDCDAIVVDPEEVEGFEKKGWFSEPGAMKKKRKYTKKDKGDGRI